LTLPGWGIPGQIVFLIIFVIIFLDAGKGDWFGVFYSR